MVHLTRLNGEDFWLNADLIEAVEKRGDTVISMINGRRLVVCETPEEVILRCAKWKALSLGKISLKAETWDEAENLVDSTVKTLEL